MPLTRRVSTVSINCFIDRARRSSFHTISVSPLRANSRASCKAGRAATAPDICSVKIFSHPASVSASRCNARFWSTVETPMIMVFEDAHWIDPTSRELLDLAVERVGSLPVLLIVTFRPEFQPPWTGQPQVTTLALNRLDRRDRTVLVEQIAGGKALPDEVVAQIADRTDGIPLFVEELTKSVLESGVPLVGIPTTLHD